MTTDQIDRAAQRRRNQAAKQQLRREMLKRLPKGGTCIEVGVWRGDFTREILDHIQPDRLCLVDPWKNFEGREDAFDGSTQDDKFEAIYEGVRSKFSPEIDSGRVEIMRELSSTALAKFDKGSVNFVYIDGDHSYDGVRQDLDAAFDIVKAGGIIMLDDYHKRGWWGDGVVRAANEFIGSHASEIRIALMRGAQLALQKY